MQIFISNEAVLTNLSPKAISLSKKHLTIPNPLFNLNVEMGYSVWGVDRDLRYYRSDASGTLYIPVGALPDVVKLLQEELGESCLPQDLVDLRSTESDAEFFKQLRCSIKLRDYQQQLVDDLLTRTIGVVQADTGSGKTVCFIEMIFRRKVNTIVLVHTRELAQQTREQIARFLNIPLEEVGFIGSGKFIKKPVTVALHQTLSRLPKEKWDEINKYFGQVISDETHLVAATTFYENINKFYAKYKFGFTATPVRSDGLTKVVHFGAGPLVYKVTSADIGDRLIRPKILEIPTHYDYPLFDTSDFTYMINDLCLDTPRNQKILAVFKEYEHRPSCILCGRVGQIEWFYSQLQDRAVMLHSKMTKRERDEAMEKLKTGVVDHVISSWELFATGIDIPRLEILHLASPKKSPIKIKQAAGRIMRLSPDTGKTESLVIDYQDSQWLLESQTKQRLKILKEVINAD